MVIIEKVDDNWPLLVNLPIEPEGLAELTNVTYPTTPLNPGDPLNIVATVTNNGDAEDIIFCKVIDEDTGEEIDTQSQSIAVGASADFSHPLIMPDRLFNLAIKTGHETIPIVTFRQSWLPDNNPSSGDWVAVDTNEDGILEGRKYEYGVGTTMPPTHSCLILISFDSLGRGVYYNICINRIYIYLGQLNPPTGSYQYWRFYEPAPEAETSSESIEPYASNGQETWKTD